MKMIAGLIEIGSGEILFGGEPIRHDLIAHKRRMGYVPEEPHLYAHLSGLEYLTMVAQLRGLAREAHRGTHRRSAAPPLAPLATATRPSRLTPRACARRSCWPAALLHDPELLLLDEPFSGLDVSTALVLRSLVQELAARGKVILFSSHELETVERVSSRVIILHRGKVVADDSIEHLRVMRSARPWKMFFRSLPWSRIRRPFPARSPT